MIAQLPARASGDDFHVQVDQEGAGRLFQHKPHRVGVECRDRIEIAITAAIGRRHLWIEDAREGVHDVCRGELVPIMKMHAVSEVHQIGLIVRRLPRARELGRQTHVLVEADQIVEEELLSDR